MIISSITALAMVLTPEPVVVSRGLTGVLEFQYDGPKLVAREPQHALETIRVRLKGPTDGGHYSVRFIGSKSGEYDLRDQLMTQDGGIPKDLPQLPIVIRSNLPREYGTDVFDVTHRSFSLEPYYFRVLWIVGLTWAAIPLATLVHRAIRRRKRIEPTVAPRVPTLPERIHDLVIVAAGGKMTQEQRAMLELLLIAYKREELHLDGLSVSDAMAVLRRHETVGEMIRAVERWNHSPNGASEVPLQAIQEIVIRALPDLSTSNTRGGIE